MRIPRRITEHPIEAAIAGLLLLALLVGSADLKPGTLAPSPPSAGVTQKS